jgi:hypothetical protein
MPADVAQIALRLMPEAAVAIVDVTSQAAPVRRLRIITARPLLGIELAIEHPRNVQNFDNQRCPDNAADQQAVNQ